MDLKEVRLHGEAITKAFQSGEPSPSLLHLLDVLNKGVRATEDILRQSKIGVTVNRLRQHKDPNVQKAAQELVQKWRDEVNKAKKRQAALAGGKPANGSAASSAAAAAAVTTSSPAPPSGTASPAAPTKKKHGVNPATRDAKSDGIKCEVYGLTARDSCVKLMYNGLAFMSEELPDEIFNVAKEVEAAAWTANGSENNDAYRTKMRSLFQNLKNKTNPTLRTRVLSGSIPPQRFVIMTHDEMKSDSRREEDERLEKENMNAAMVAQVEKSISTEFQCSSCKMRMVSYSQAQTRSADEPMTTFCECMNCGKRWKFS